MEKVSPFSPMLPTKTQDKAFWGNLHGTSKALAIAEFAKIAKANLLIITKDNLQAVQLTQELEFFLPENPIPLLTYPDWETLPYDSFSPHQDIISERLRTLYKLSRYSESIVIIPVTTLMHRLPPREFLESSSFLLKVGDKFSLENTRRTLEQRSYRHVSQVYEHGEFTVRGSIFDVFPMGSDYPLRIDLLDDEVDSLRLFDPETQRTLEKINNIEILPAREFPLDEKAITRFRQQWRETFGGNPMQCPVYEQVTQGVCPAGIEYYLPLFYEKTETLFDYLPKSTYVISLGNISDAAKNFEKEVAERFKQRNFDSRKPLLPTQQLFLNDNELHERMNHYPQIQLLDGLEENKKHAIVFNTEIPPLLTIEHKKSNPLELFLAFEKSQKRRILLAAESPGRREMLLTLFAKHGITLHPVETWSEFLAAAYPLGITVGKVYEGLVVESPAIALVTESQLLGQQVMQRRRRKKLTQDADFAVRNLAELSMGSPVVHIEHGVGRYMGLQTITTGDITAEYLVLLYENDAKLYVPVSSLQLISRYSGMDLEHAPLHRLGTAQWSKEKEKAAKRARDAAAELLHIYAERESRRGHAFAKPDTQYEAFAASFPFEETPDQEQAIENVINDMVAEKPMDRLICGDVGFGKTEVAIRAAFIAVNNNKQVALLVPTTLLAQQHYETFCDRFADWPVNIAVISRFKSKKEQTHIVEQLQKGKVDIIIGTHKLIQENIAFERLGLLIIDEEHRFGVRQKEKIKSLRAEVDILTLTATPIPRTLNMAMSGMRDLSIIATPPAKRLSIKTFVYDYEASLIREAVLREILRGGQVYFLHNTVDTIEKMAEDLRKIIPEAHVGIAHGQMKERELEKIMADFYHQRFNVLVCTTIIETGIDIPTANTIIINRADHFGLAQLHQLRGRVGRSHHQAYAYLLIPNEKAITKDAEKRLDALCAYEDLGVGFTIATHDLEIRGAGELLGDEQSGHIQAIGISLYMELLERSVASLKAGKEPNLENPFPSTTEVDLKVSALIPEDYLPDVHERLVLYKRIASAKDDGELEEMKVEIFDRFGILPKALESLFLQTSLKLLAKTIGVKKIEINETGGKLEFLPDASIDLPSLILLIQSKPLIYKFSAPTKLSYQIQEPLVEKRVEHVFGLLEKLSLKKEKVSC